MYLQRGAAPDDGPIYPPGKEPGRHWVGREAECRLFVRYLAGGRTRRTAPILNVWGPAGVGKSTLLDAFRHRAEAAGAGFLLFDLPDLARTPGALMSQLERLEREAAARPVAVAIDSYEPVDSLDGWLREVFLPRLPERALVVIASRVPLARIWQGAPAWRQLVYPLPLAPFDLPATRAFLRRHGIRDEAAVRSAHRATGGLPLALTLAVLALRRGHPLPPQGLPGQPEVVAELAARWLREVPDPRLESLVEAAAVARRFDQDLLEHLTGSPVTPDEWQRLTGLSFARLEYGGWALHGLVRATLLRDLAWRRPARLQALRQGALYHCARLLTQDPPAPGWGALLEDFFFLAGDALIGAAFFAPEPAGADPGLYVVPATRADLPDLEAYSATCCRQAETGGPVPFHMVDAGSGTRFSYPYLWVDFVRVPLAWRTFLALGPGVVRLARDSLGALRGVSVAIPIHRDTLPYLATQPVTRSYFAALSPAEAEALAVAPAHAAGWFIRHLHTADLRDAPARSALLRDLFRLAFRNGCLVASTPSPFFQDLLQRCGFVAVPGATHHDFGPDLPSPTWVLDVRGDRLAAWLERLLHGRATPVNPAAGELARALAGRLAARDGQQHGPPAPAIPPGGPALTPREQEVCQAVLEGLANKEIALRLGVSLLTIKKHLSNIFAKLAVSSRTQLIRRLLAGHTAGVGGLQFPPASASPQSNRE